MQYLLKYSETMNHEAIFKDRLRAAGERFTTPRLGIFRLLYRQGPLSMPKLIDRAGSEGIDSVTVYRTVELFRRLDFIQEVGLGRQRLLELSDDYEAHHHHLVCGQCGRIIDFDSAAIEAELQRVSRAQGFQLRTHQLEATGLCRQCAATAATA